MLASVARVKINNLIYQSLHSLFSIILTRASYKTECSRRHVFTAVYWTQHYALWH